MREMVGEDPNPTIVHDLCILKNIFNCRGNQIFIEVISKFNKINFKKFENIRVYNTRSMGGVQTSM